MSGRAAHVAASFAPCLYPNERRVVLSTEAYPGKRIRLTSKRARGRLPPAADQGVLHSLEQLRVYDCRMITFRNNTPAVAALIGYPSGVADIAQPLTNTIAIEPVALGAS